ncbi:ASCH domain-containing protein [Lactobacillus amylovorus]|uniref:ASCH domain-containing protein n=1 Tax=Lactobacillus amylovorus TaxID=1604 RepID=UPI00232DD4D9|nr:ASCH domain-containing protein [Lactobacillus amylovorus]MDB6255632.1 ASCH domain-containing protein [Lactobacillus amylovorus]
MNKISIEKYWQNFCDKHNLNENIPYDAWAFGMTDEQADELANLVNQNIKTATTSAYELYDKNEPLPQVGEFSIILNSVGKPVCVIQEKCVEIIPYNLISAEHAYHEGEGDRSYNYWRKVHDDFFEREYQEAEKIFYPQAPMVCEVFEKIE